MKLNEKLKSILRQMKMVTKHTNLWYAAKAGPRGKFISINADLKK